MNQIIEGLLLSASIYIMRIDILHHKPSTFLNFSGLRLSKDWMLQRVMAYDTLKGTKHRKVDGGYREQVFWSMISSVRLLRRDHGSVLGNPALDSPLAL